SRGLRIDADHHRIERHRHILAALLIINGILEKAVITYFGKVLRQQTDILHIYQFFLVFGRNSVFGAGFYPGFYSHNEIVTGFKNRITQYEHYNYTKNVQSSFHTLSVLESGER